MIPTSFVRLSGGVPTLFINGQPMAGVAYITYLPERAAYREFADAGYKLYSFSCFFGTRGINENSGIYPFAEGIFDSEEPDYTVFDGEVRRILSFCPDAYIFPRVNVSTSVRWDRAHVSELNDRGLGGRDPRPSFASRAWREEVKRCFSLLIEHIEKSDYRERIVGYQISGGNTEEWFPFDLAGGESRCARESFSEKYPSGSEIDRRRHMNDITAECIAELAAHVKKLTDRRLIVGSFYGYTFETAAWTSTHHSLMKLLSSSDIDFLCSPISYDGLRSPGKDYASMTVLDSVKLHGKLYFTECDVRTHLTKPLSECRRDSCPAGTYADAVWQARGDLRLTRNVIRAVFARQLTHGNALWWFDMFGGWFSSPEVMDDMREIGKIAETSLRDRNRASVAELAVVAEDEQFLYMESHCAAVSRYDLGLTGTPYDAFEINDFDYVLSHYKAVLFIAPHMSCKMKEKIALTEEKKLPYLIQTNEAVQSYTEIREMCKKAGVHLYTDEPDALFVSENYIVLHPSTGGKKLLRLKERSYVTKMFADADAFVTDTIEIDAEQYGTYFYRLDRTGDI